MIYYIWNCCIFIEMSFKLKQAFSSNGNVNDNYLFLLIIGTIFQI